MPSLWITTAQTNASVQSEHVVIKPLTKDSALDSTKQIPLIDIDLVVLGQSVHFSSHLLRVLLRKNIPVILLNRINQVEGQFLPPQPPRGNTRLQQYQFTHDLQQVCTTIAKPLIEAKIYNQRRSLQRLALNRGISDQHHHLYKRFTHALTRLDTSRLDLDSILGIEGSIAADFYNTWKTFLPEEFPYQRRSRRPPMNPVNACLSFAATILYQEMLAASFAAGLDPALGHLHITNDNRWSLPLDLIEPFRPIIVDALTLDLFSRGILNADHFEPSPDEAGIYLNHIGRNKLILHYEKRMERYFHSEHLGQRTTLRQLIHAAPLNYKRSILTNTPLTPFKMN